MLADTDFVVDYLRGEERARARLVEADDAGDGLVLPAPVVYELYRGVVLSRAPEEERRKVAAVVAGRPVADLDRAAAAFAGELDGRLRRLGRTIDPEDTMIAGIALSRGEGLLTRNVRHFARVDGLRIVRY